MANPIQNLWPEARVVASTVTSYAVEDAGGFFELVVGGEPDATLADDAGYAFLDPTAPAPDYRFFSVGASPVTISPVGA